MFKNWYSLEPAKAYFYKVYKFYVRVDRKNFFFEHFLPLKYYQDCWHW